MKRIALLVIVAVLIIIAASLFIPIPQDGTTKPIYQVIIENPPTLSANITHPTDSRYYPGPPSSPGGPPLLPEIVERTDRYEAGYRGDEVTYKVSFPSATFTPIPGIEDNLQRILETTTLERIHVIMQVNYILALDEIARLESMGAYFQEGFYAPGEYGATMVYSIPVENASVIIQDPAVLWLGAIDPEDKNKAKFDGPSPPPEWLEPDGTTKLSISFYSDMPQEEGDRLEKRYNLGKIYYMGGASVSASVKPEYIAYLAREEYVKRIERGGDLTSLNFDVRNITGAEFYQQNIQYLNGSGVKAGIWDVADGANPYYVDGTHSDLTGRVTYAENNNTPVGFLTHATHVAGTLGGTGAGSEADGWSPLQWRGLAPNVNLISYRITDDNDFFNDHNAAINTYRINVSQNSWGFIINSANCDRYGDYTSYSKVVDRIVNGSWGRPIPVIFAAGNDRDDADCPIHETGNGYSTLPDPATAKNAIVVGAVNDSKSMTQFSSWGPTDDGRIKPDIVSSGCKGSLKPAVGFLPDSDEYIFSTIPSNDYGGACGTSMSAPVVSGIIALMLEQYRYTYPDDEYPLPSTLKAILLHTAEDLNNTGPDYTTGWGEVNATSAIEFVKNKNFLESNITIQNETDEYEVFVPSGQEELKVTLVWDDPGTTFYSKDLVNNLDLLLISPNGTVYYPWILDWSQPHVPAITGIDFLNNVEQARVNNPVPGIWTVRVSGQIVSSISPNGQNYSLAGPFGLDFTNYTMLNITDSHKAFRLKVVNNNQTNKSLSWGIELGNTTWLNSSQPINLSPQKMAFIFVEHNYTHNSSYQTTAFTSTGDWNESQKITFSRGLGLSLANFTILQANNTEYVFGLKINNANQTTNATLLNWSVWFGNASSAVADSLSTIANLTEHFLYFWHNFTSPGSYTVNASAWNQTLEAAARPIKIEV